MTMPQYGDWMEEFKGGSEDVPILEEVEALNGSKRQNDLVARTTGRHPEGAPTVLADHRELWGTSSGVGVASHSRSSNASSGVSGTGNADGSRCRGRPRDGCASSWDRWANGRDVYFIDT